MWCFGGCFPLICLKFLHFGLSLPFSPSLLPSCAPSSVLSHPPFLTPTFHHHPPHLTSTPHLHPLPWCSAEAATKYQISKPTLCSLHPGEVLRLSCPLPEAGPVTWTKDGSPLAASNRTLIEQEVLQVRDATPKDSGLYACTSAGRDTVCFIVNVTGESGGGGGGGGGGGEDSAEGLGPEDLPLPPAVHALWLRGLEPF